MKRIKNRQLVGVSGLPAVLIVGDEQQQVPIMLFALIENAMQSYKVDKNDQATVQNARGLLGASKRYAKAVEEKLDYVDFEDADILAIKNVYMSFMGQVDAIFDAQVLDAIDAATEPEEG